MVGKLQPLDWINQPRHKVLDLPEVAYAEVGQILARYAALDPDFTDAAIVWLAQACDCRAILTVDVRGFAPRKALRFSALRVFAYMAAPQLQ
jgi:predicted nucleic acid-binding protein